MQEFLIANYPYLCGAFLVIGALLSYGKKKFPFAGLLCLYGILFFSLFSFLQVLHNDSVAPFCFTGVMLVDLLLWNEA